MDPPQKCYSWQHHDRDMWMMNVISWGHVICYFMDMMLLWDRDLTSHDECTHVTWYTWLCCDTWECWMLDVGYKHNERLEWTTCDHDWDEHDMGLSLVLGWTPQWCCWWWMERWSWVIIWMWMRLIDCTHGCCCVLKDGVAHHQQANGRDNTLQHTWDMNNTWHDLTWHDVQPTLYHDIITCDISYVIFDDMMCMLWCRLPFKQPLFKCGREGSEGYTFHMLLTHSHHTACKHAGTNQYVAWACTNGSARTGRGFSRSQDKRGNVALGMWRHVMFWVLCQWGCDVPVGGSLVVVCSSGVCWCGSLPMSCHQARLLDLRTDVYVLFRPCDVRVPVFRAVSPACRIIAPYVACDDVIMCYLMIYYYCRTIMIWIIRNSSLCNNFTTNQ